MLITGNDRQSQIAVCLKAAPLFLLSADEALALAAHQIELTRAKWESVCDEAKLTAVDRNFFWRRRFFNPFAFEGAPPYLTRLLT